MSLTSYRAAPPRDIRVSEGGMRHCEWVQMTCTHVARASMPGDDLLFHRLSDSTIGAGGFHGRVRDGIGWDTDAIATRQWSRCDMRARYLWGTPSGLAAVTGLLKSRPCMVVVVFQPIPRRRGDRQSGVRLGYHPHRTMANWLPSVVIDGGTLKRE